MFTEEPKWDVLKDFDYRPSPCKIHLFRINVEESYPKIEDCYTEILSAEELNRASRFLLPRDRESFIARRYFLRKILSSFLSSSPRDLQYFTVGNKKPAISGIEFSVSHSSNYAVVAVSLTPLGVDLEYIDPTFSFKPMLDSCFDIEEQLFIKANTDAIEGLRSYALWTRKEALLKATSEGLNENLALINGLTDDVFRKGTQFQLRTLRFDKHYVLSLATPIRAGVFKYWHVQ